MAKAIKTISKTATVKANAALLSNQKFVADEAKLIVALENLDTSRGTIIEVMQLYATDVVRLASIRLGVITYGMFTWASNKNKAALAADAKTIPPYVKCDRAYCATLAAWDAKDAAGKPIVFPVEFKGVRQAGYDKWREVCNMSGVDAKVLNPAGAPKTATGSRNGKRKAHRKAKTAAQAKGAANANANQDAATAAANANADKIRVNATGVETVNTLAALKSAYQTDEARLVKLQAANAKLYTGDVFKAHEELMAAFKRFYAAAN